MSVRSSGYCYEDFIFNPDIEVVIDMSGMSTGSQYDRRAVTAVVHI